MKKITKTVLILFGLAIVHTAAFVQGQTFTVSGNVRDGEDLIGVSIAVMQAGNRETTTGQYIDLCRLLDLGLRFCMPQVSYGIFQFGAS